MPLDLRNYTGIQMCWKKANLCWFDSVYQLCSVTLTLMTQLIIITDKSRFLAAAANWIRQEEDFQSLPTAQNWHCILYYHNHKTSPSMQSKLDAPELICDVLRGHYFWTYRISRDTTMRGKMSYCEF